MSPARPPVGAHSLLEGPGRRPEGVPVTPARLDLYRPIHKALRAALFDTTRRLGAMDAEDPVDVERTASDAGQLLAWLAGHLRRGNDFLHAAIEARRPGGAQAGVDAHRGRLDALAALGEELAMLRHASPAERAAVAARLYPQWHRFVADELAHMQREECENNAELWSLYTDAELAALHDRLLASMPPAEQRQSLAWLAQSLAPAELAGLLAQLREQGPPEAFGAALAAVHPRLGDARWARLTRALGLPPAPGRPA